MRLWRTFVIVAAVAVAVVACSKREQSGVGHLIVIDPTVTRASEFSFDNGDRIGLTITKDGEQSPYISNAEFTSDGSLFTGGGVTWYGGSKSAAMRAYYPYDPSGEPTSFTVKSDQRGEGYTQSDFMTSVKSGVAPTQGAVSMIFSHKMAKINIAITNDTEKVVTEAGIVSCAVTADVDVAAESVQAAASSPTASIAARETTPQSLYNAIIVPQSAALTFYLKFDDDYEMQTAAMTAAEFVSGRQYTARLTVTEEHIEVQLSGEITGWGENTDLTPDENADSDEQRKKPQAAVSWGGDTYQTVTLADGRTWLASNLRYVPDGKSVSSAPADGSGLWYTCTASKTATTDEGVAAEYGYLYDAKTAHGGTLQRGQSAVRGICPEGWHLPTAAEFEALMSAYPTPAALLESGFAGVVGGYISAMGSYMYNNGGEINLWGSDSTEDDRVYCLRITGGGTSYTPNSTFPAASGVSVRCIRDE